MEVDQFITNFVEAIEGVDPDAVTPSTQFRSLPQWDSLALLCLLAMIDCEYEVQIGGLDVKSAETIQDLFALVQAKVAA